MILAGHLSRSAPDLNNDSQNSFSVHHDSQTPKMFVHGITKVSLYLSPPNPLCKRAACVKDNLELGFSQAQQQYFDTGNLIPLLWPNHRN